MRMTKTKPYCTDENWHGRPDCKHCAIRGTVLFSALTEAQLEDALLDIDNKWCEADSELFAQDALDGYLYTVRAGCVKMVHKLNDGTTRIVRLHHRGDAIGLEALLGEPYRHTAVILQRADVCRIPVKAIRKLEDRNPDLYQQLMLRWQSSLDEAECFITDLNTGTAEDRLARLLLKLDSHSEGKCIPDLRREDIAAMIGVTTETSSRLMADFRRRKLVWNEENKHIRCDAEALKKLV
jgi:CRP/FNR family transcriptional regulator, anaerobic regulatory protein